MAHSIILSANCISTKINQILAYAEMIDQLIETASQELAEEIETRLEPFAGALSAICNGGTVSLSNVNSLDACVAEMESILNI